MPWCLSVCVRTRGRNLFPSVLLQPVGHLNPGKVFDQTLPLYQVAEAYRAMGEPRAVKTPLRRDALRTFCFEP